MSISAPIPQDEMGVVGHSIRPSGENAAVKLSEYPAKETPDSSRSNLKGGSLYERFRSRS